MEWGPPEGYETKSLHQHKFKAAGTALPLPSTFHCSGSLPGSPVARGHAWAVTQVLEKLSRKNGWHHLHWS